MAEPQFTDRTVWPDRLGLIWHKGFSNPRGRRPGIKTWPKGLVGAARDGRVPASRTDEFFAFPLFARRAALSKLRQIRGGP